MTQIIWQGNFCDLGMWSGAVDDVYFALTKVARSVDVKCHVRHAFDAEGVDSGQVLCHFVTPVRKVALSIGKVVLFMCINDVRPEYRRCLLKQGRIMLHF